MDYQKLFDLTGKVCIVIGGTGYLGSANACALKDFGATVVVAAHRHPDERKDKPAYPLRYDMFVKCDAGDADSVQACFQKVYDTYGRIDVLVNCAWGKETPMNSPKLLEMSIESFDGNSRAFLSSIFLGIQRVAPFMAKNGGGSIINYSTMYALVSPDLRIYSGEYEPKWQPCDYGAAKAGVLQLTRYAASDLASMGIRVNCVTPGPFPEPRHQSEGFNALLSNKTMLNRFGVNHEISGPVVLLASDASSFMTGTNIVVDGGWTAW